MPKPRPRHHLWRYALPVLVTSSCAPAPEADVASADTTSAHPVTSYLADPAAYEHLRYDGPPPRELVAIAQTLVADPRYVQLQLAAIDIMDHALTVQAHQPAAVATYLATQPQSEADLLAFPAALGAATPSAHLVHGLSIQLAADHPGYRDHPFQVHVFAMLMDPTLNQALDAMLRRHPSIASRLDPADSAAIRAGRLYDLNYAMMRADAPPDEGEPPMLPEPTREEPSENFLAGLVLGSAQFLVDLSVGNIVNGLAIMLTLQEGSFLTGWARFALGIAATYALPAILGVVGIAVLTYALIRVVFEPIVRALGALYEAWLESGLFPGRHPDDECREDTDCRPGWCRRGPLGIGINRCMPLRAPPEPCRRAAQCTTGRCRINLGIPPTRTCR